MLANIPQHRYVRCIEIADAGDGARMDYALEVQRRQRGLVPFPAM